MKKIILITILGIMLGGLGIMAYFLSRDNNSTTSASKLVDNVNWNVADSYDLTLEESTTITKGGIYTITGTIKDGQLLVNTSDEVKLILNNVSITNSNGPAIYIEDSNCTYIELVGENTLNATVSEDLEVALLSKDDLYISGEGTLKVISNLDGISSSDNLTINGGVFILEVGDDGIKGKDSLVIENGTFTITSGGDSIKTTNEEELGNLVIENGTFNIKTEKSSSSTSPKGIKSEGNMTINGGVFTINTNDDGIHSNSDLTINNGEFTITCNDDAIHADGKLEINDGSFTISAHEGLEATYVKINGGTIHISASDDGINAGNKSNNYTTTIEINGGNITIKMGQGDTDGIDSNGNLYINGGTIDITGNSPFDYDGEAKYTSGTIIVNGETTNAITNQFMGGGMTGGMPNGKDERQEPNGGTRRR